MCSTHWGFKVLHGGTHDKPLKTGVFENGREKSERKLSGLSAASTRAN